jgi:hypothetical protein
MTVRILVTDARGLVGSALTAALIDAHFDVIEFDGIVEPGRPGHGDIRDASAMQKAAARCGGIMHLAAVSRVAWGERYPERLRKGIVKSHRDPQKRARCRLCPTGGFAGPQKNVIFIAGCLWGRQLWEIKHFAE